MLQPSSYQDQSPECGPCVPPSLPGWPKSTPTTRYAPALESCPLFQGKCIRCLLPLSLPPTRLTVLSWSQKATHWTHLLKGGRRGGRLLRGSGPLQSQRQCRGLFLHGYGFPPSSPHGGLCPPPCKPRWALACSICCPAYEG